MEAISLEVSNIEGSIETAKKIRQSAGRLHFKIVTSEYRMKEDERLREEEEKDKAEQAKLIEIAKTRNKRKRIENEEKREAALKKPAPSHLFQTPISSRRQSFINFTPESSISSSSSSTSPAPTESTTSVSPTSLGASMRNMSLALPPLENPPAQPQPPA